MSDNFTKAREWAAKNSAELQKRQAELKDTRRGKEIKAVRAPRLNDSEALEGFLKMGRQLDRGQRGEG